MPSIQHFGLRWIIGPDAVHHLFLGEFKREFPDAKVIAVHEAIQKKTKEGIEFHGGELPINKAGSTN